MSELSVGALSGLAANSYVIDVASGSTLDLSNGAVFPAGSIIQVVSTTKTDAFSTTSTSFTDFTGLSASITPTSTSSKIMVFASFVYGVTNASQSFSANLVRDTTAIGQGTGGSTSNQTKMNFTNNASVTDDLSLQFLDSPSTTSATTYKVQVKSNGGTTIFFGRNADGAFSSISTITLMEVAG